MLYVWRCDDCETVTEVNRKVKDIDLQPEDGCSNCKSNNLKRVITTANFSLVYGSGNPWHNEGYDSMGRKD